MNDIDAINQEYKAAARRAMSKRATPQDGDEARELRHELDQAIIDLASGAAAARERAAGMTTVASENVSQQFRDLAAGRIDCVEFPVKPEIRTTVDTGTGAGAYGGYTIRPGSFSQQIWVHRLETTPWLSYATRLNTATGDTLRIPTTTSDPATYAVSEGAEIGSSNPVFSTLQLGAFKYGMLVAVTNELLQDTSLDLSGLLARLTARSIGRAVGTQLIQGDGTTEPGGLELNSTQGVASESKTTPLLDDYKALYWSVDTETQARGVWLTSAANLLALSYARDDDGRFMWQPDIAAGTPPTLFGRPILMDPFVRSGTGTKSVFFGDLSAYYYREAGSLRFEASRDAGWSDDTTIFRAILRCDGGLADGDAVKHILMA